MRREHYLNVRTGRPTCGKRGPHTLRLESVTCRRCKAIARATTIKLLHLNWEDPRCQDERGRAIPFDFGRDDFLTEMAKHFCAGVYQTVHSFEFANTSKASPLAVAEMVWFSGNHMDDATHGEHGCLDTCPVKGRRSMSVGDIVLIDGEPYVARSMGFERLPGLRPVGSDRLEEYGLA